MLDINKYSNIREPFIRKLNNADKRRELIGYQTKDWFYLLTISKLCVKNVKTGREDLSKQISYRNLHQYDTVEAVKGTLQFDG